MRQANKFISLALVVLFVGVMAVGCGGKQAPQGQATQGQAPAEQTAPIEFKIAHQWPEQSHFAQSIKFFADTITEKTGGKITFKIFPANSLVSIQEMLDAVADGVADIGFTSSSWVAPKMKEMTIFEIPGAFDPDKIGEVAKAIQPLLRQIFDQYGVVYLWALDDGETGLALNKIVHSPADLRGLKIRNFGPWVGKAYEAWGAVPMTIPPADLNAALERGTVDGAYASWSFLRSYKVHEQRKAVTFTGLQTMWSFLIMNKDSWNKLTPEQQEIFQEAGQMAMEHNIKLCNELNPKYKEEIKAAGGQVYDLTDAERAVFIEKTKPVFDEARKIIGPLGNELLDKLQSLQ